MKLLLSYENLLNFEIKGEIPPPFIKYFNQKIESLSALSFTSEGFFEEGKCKEDVQINNIVVNQLKSTISSASPSLMRVTSFLSCTLEEQIPDQFLCSLESLGFLRWGTHRPLKGYHMPQQEVRGGATHRRYGSLNFLNESEH